MSYNQKNMTKPQKQPLRQTATRNSQSLTRHSSSRSPDHTAWVPPSPPTNQESRCSPWGHQHVSNRCAAQTATLQQEETSNAKGHFVNLKLKQKSFYSFCSTSLPGCRRPGSPTSDTKPTLHVGNIILSRQPKWLPYASRCIPHATRDLSLTAAVMLTAIGTGFRTGQGSAAPYFSPKQCYLKFHGTIKAIN